VLRILPDPWEEDIIPEFFTAQGRVKYNSISLVEQFRLFIRREE
jgi:hypothetical protein